MADPDRRLIEQHRQQQLALRAEMLRELVATWPLLDPRRLEATSPGWLQLAGTLIADYRGRSAAQGTEFYGALRDVRTGLATTPAVPALTWAEQDQAVSTSLRVLGPVAVKYRTGLGQEPDRAARSALVEVAGAAGRHVLTGAREAVHTAVESDPAAIGFSRYASATACAFCKLLAGRGAVYLSRASATQGQRRGGRARQRYHDGCACLPVPRFSRDDPLPPGAEEYERLWVEASAGRSGDDAIAEFRRRVTAPAAPSAAPADAAVPTPVEDLPTGQIPTDWLDRSLDNATPAELAALRLYTTPAHQEINQALRGEIPMTPDTQAVVDLIDTALSRSALPGWSRSLRVTGPDAFGLARAADIPTLIGATFTQRSFLSITAVGERTPAFRIKDPLLLDVLVPPGVPGRYLEPITTFPGQYEVLLRRDLMLVVHSARYDEQLQRWRAVIIAAEVNP